MSRLARPAMPLIGGNRFEERSVSGYEGLERLHVATLTLSMPNRDVGQELTQQ